MRISSSSILRKWSFYGSILFSFGLLISFQNCSKINFQAAKEVVTNKSCGDIIMTPSRGLKIDENVNFELVVPASTTITNLAWTFTKEGGELFKSPLNPVSHTFNGAGEGYGIYEAIATFVKSNGDICVLNEEFHIAEFCGSPTGISGPIVGFVGEETSAFSINFEDCIKYSAEWDMDNDNNSDFILTENIVETPVSFTYESAGTYTVRATLTNPAQELVQLSHQIVISNRNCVNPFTNLTVPHGQSVEFAKTNPACGSTCLKTNKTCNNGVLVGDATYTLNPATCAASTACACPNGATNPPDCSLCPSGKVLISNQCVTATCANSPVLPIQVSIARFPPTAGCNWSDGESISREDKHMTSRVEQEQAIQIPSNAALCSLSLQSAAQEFRYDDHIFLTLNNAVLMTTSAPVLPQSLSPTDANGNYIYDWLKLRGDYINNDSSTIYCNGSSVGSTCTLPQTQDIGPLSINIASSTLQKIAPTASGYKLKMITTGDDNISEDCRHTDVTFTVSGTYCPTCTGQEPIP